MLLRPALRGPCACQGCRDSHYIRRVPSPGSTGVCGGGGRRRERGGGCGNPESSPFPAGRHDFGFPWRNCGNSKPKRTATRRPSPSPSGTRTASLRLRQNACKEDVSARRRAAVIRLRGCPVRHHAASSGCGGFACASSGCGVAYCVIRRIIGCVIRLRGCPLCHQAASPGCGVARASSGCVTRPLSCRLRHQAASSGCGVACASSGCVTRLRHCSLRASSLEQHRLGAQTAHLVRDPRPLSLGARSLFCEAHGFFFRHERLRVCRCISLFLYYLWRLRPR